MTTVLRVFRLWSYKCNNVSSKQLYFNLRKSEKKVPGEVQLLLPKTALMPRSQSRMDSDLRPPATSGILTFPKVNRFYKHTKIEVSLSILISAIDS